MTRLTVLLSVLAAVLLLAPTAASAKDVRSCGNYGYPEGHAGDTPIFTDEPIVGAGVEGIRVRAIGCRQGRRMVKAFWNGRFDCNAGGSRCSYGSFTCRNRRLGDEYWLMRCFGKPRHRMLKFRFGA